MNNNTPLSVVLFMVWTAIFFAFGIAIGDSHRESVMRYKAIELGYAGYDYTTGNWQWKTNLIKIERQ
jgi:hypothetical protein